MSEPALPGADAAFFARDGERFVPSVWTRGPWSDAHQHGGPPSALLARAVEEAAGPEREVARVTIELLRPVPIAPLRVEVEPEREGRLVARYLARLRDEQDQVLFEARFLCVLRREVAVPALPADVPDPPPGPEASPAFQFPFFRTPEGYHAAMEVRLARGEWGAGGPIAAWLRMRIPLVAGEEPSPLQRTLVAADAGSGVGAALDTRRWTFLNTDLTLHLRRPLRGPWVGMTSWLTAEGTGVGQCETALRDPDGPVGRGQQTLVVQARER